MQRKRTADRQQWLYRVYKFGATLHDLSPPAKWPESLRQVVRAQRDLWNACHAAWDTNRQQYEDLMTQGEALTPLREARDVALAGLADVQARITAGRQDSRTRAYAGSVPDQDTLRAARTRLTQAKDTLTLAEIAYRNAIRPQLTALLDALWQRVHDLGQAAPLAWYNERQVTDSFRNCVERFLRRQGGPPQPKRHLTSAHLTYHFTGPPLTWEQLLLGKSSMITFFQSSGVSDSSPVKRLPARFQSYRSPDKGLPAETPEETEKRLQAFNPTFNPTVSGSDATGDAREGGATGQSPVLPVPAWVWDDTQPQNPRRRASYTTGHLRISDTDTLDFGVTLQRRPPEGSLVKGVELVGRERSRGSSAHLPLWEWSFVVLCEIPPRALVQEGDPASEERTAACAPVPGGEQAPEVVVVPCAPVPGVEQARGLQRAALDLNWRILDDDRIRVGMVFDGTSYTPLYFPAQLVRRWRYCQDLQNDISAQLERCKDTLKRLWDETPLPPDIDPRGAGWVPTGQGGLLRLLRAATELPPALPSRQPTLDVLERWAQRTGKLWREWRGVSNHLDRAKAAWYSVEAKRLCTQYQTIALEALDLKRMAESKEQAPRLSNSQKYRQLVGLGAFLLRLTHTAQREGVTLVKVDPAGTTNTCALCGSAVEQTGEAFLACAHGHRLDTDVNASQIIYRRAFGNATD